MIPAELRGPLGRLRQRCVLLAVLRGAGLALAIFLIGSVCAGWTDLIVHLPFALRISLTALCAAGSLLVLAYAIATVVRTSTSRRMAAALDRVGATGGQIQAGVELGEAAAPSDPLTADLQARAIALSSSLARVQDLARAQPAAPAFKPWFCAGAVLVLLMLAWIAWPGLVTAQAARMLDPRRDHAAMSPYTFEIRPSATKVIFGDPFDVAVRVSGANPRERFDWIVEQDGRAPWTLPLIGRSDGSLQGSLGSVAADFHFRIRGPQGESDALAIQVITVPEVKETAVRIVYPEYTRLASFEGSLQAGGASGVRGTKVTLLIASNRPLKGGTLTLHADAAKNLSPEILLEPQSNDKIVAGTFEITGDLSFSALIHDVNGTPARAPVQGRCLLIPDQPPRVTLREPREQSYSTPDISLPVVIEAEDDFGISEIILYRSLNGSSEVPLSVPVTPPHGLNTGRGMVTERYELTLPLKKWGLEPGDVLEISALARDNDSAGAKTAQSALHRVTIIDRERYLELLRQQETIDDLNERYLPWLRKLNELRKKWEMAHEKNNDPKQIAELREALRESIEKLGEQLKEPPVFSADLQLAKELRELQESLRQALGELDGGDYDGVEQRLGAAEEKAEKDLELPLEMLTKMYRLIEDESLYTALAQTQEDLAHRAARFEKIKTPSAQEQRDLRALGEEQREMAAAVEQLMQSIRNHAGQLPKVEQFAELLKTANEFATKVHDLEIGKALDEAAAAFEKPDGAKAQELSNKAAELMLSLVKKDQGGMGGQALNKLRGFGPHISDTVSQMLGGKGLPMPGQKGGGGGRGLSMGHGGHTGLYGDKPQKSRGGGGGKNANGGAAGKNSGQKLDDAEGFGHVGQFDDGSGTSVPLGAIPSRYRSAVRDFNRKIADEGVHK